MIREMKVCITKWDLFSEYYPKREICFTPMADTFVSEGIDNQEISRWTAFEHTSGELPMPVIISAQTGKGKNYFITHNLREFALRNKQKILYISNRVALDYQQKKELAGLTYSDFFYKRGDIKSWEDEENFSNVTVITYHKLLRYFSQKEKNKSSWFDSFDYVVLDECHFFYSDALFNPYTWYILGKIVEKFKNSVRIYMSATLDDVVEPIRYFEGRNFDDKSDLKPFAYQFPKDYSQYKQHYFSDISQIENLIIESRKNEKWLIFVDNKTEGKKLSKRLNEKGVITTYLDSRSRTSEKDEEQLAWNKLKTKGTLEGKVLITTSVLDNGFSIRDKDICHIVLCTHDKTEFLQELGRYRLEKEQVVNLYIKKLTENEHRERKDSYSKYRKLIISFYGEDEYGNYIKEGNPIKTVQHLWNRLDNDSFQRGAIYLADMEEKWLSPCFNDMFRWRVRRMGEQVREYEEMLNDDPAAPIHYKASWLGEKSEYVDLDIEDQNAAVLALIYYLESFVGKELDEDGNGYEEFSKKFVELYKAVYPKDESVRRGQVRQAPKHTFVNNHLMKVKENTGRDFVLQKKDGDIWILVENVPGSVQDETIAQEADLQ